MSENVSLLKPQHALCSDGFSTAFHKYYAFSFWRKRTLHGDFFLCSWKIGKTSPGLMNLCFCGHMQRVESEFGINSTNHESRNPTCIVSTVQAGGGGVTVWGMLS